MSRPLRYLLLALPLLAVLPLAASPDQPASAPKPAADPLADLRRDPPQYARLMQEARAFLALPPEQRERMRLLDEALQKAGGPARQEHLRRVLRRYADWLERLPEAQRRLVLEAPTRQTRLRNIRELRLAQWLQHEPRAVRSALKALELGATAQPALGALAPAAALMASGADSRPLLVKWLQREERKRRNEWRIAVRHWDDLGKRPLPTRLSEFRPEVEKYVKEYLLPRISAEEKERLNQAEGRFVFPYILVELADRHPPALQGERGPTHFAELPTDVQEHLKRRVSKRPKGWEFIHNKQLRPHEGKWPRYAVAVSSLAVKFNMKLSVKYEFWPARHEDLSPAVREFVDRSLWERLSPEEKNLLGKKKGRWPDYPRTIQELATKHGLRVPWQTLPGERKAWDNFRLQRKAAAGPAPEPRGRPPHEVGRLALAPPGRLGLLVPAGDE